MTHGFSLDLRTRVIDNLERGMSAEEAAVKDSLSARTVYAWHRMKRETDSLQPRQGKAGPKRNLE